MKNIKVKLKTSIYDVVVGSGVLDQVKTYFNLDRKVFVITDDGVPTKYVEKITANAKESFVYTVASGEQSKNIQNYTSIISAMINFGMTRTDVIVAVGGGVVGDLGGFVASTYMRGIDFYNVPTTLLAMVDSSIGGKTAIDFDGVKNVVGAFYQPKKVLVDVDTSKTLSKRQISNGLAESIKMAVTLDKGLFEILKDKDILENLEEIIYRSILIKVKVVTKDEKESGLRKVLNFGHTLAHGIESSEKMQNLYHGEAVSIGMIPMCSSTVQKELIHVLKKANLPIDYNGDIDSALSYVKHDKKCKGDNIDVIWVEKKGSFKMITMRISDFVQKVKSNIKDI